MKKLTLLGLAFVHSMAAQASDWYLVDDNANTQMFVDKRSILVNPNRNSTVEYTNVIVSKNDLNPTLLNNFKLIAHVVDDCSNNTQAVVSVKVLDAGNVLVRNSDVTYQSLQPKKVNLNSPKGKGHLYACEIGAKYPILTPVAEEVAPSDLVIPKVSPVEENTDGTKLYRFEGKDWLYIAKNDKAKVYVQPDNIKYNSRTKMATYFMRLESITDTNADFTTGQYIVSQNVGDCSKDTMARLYVSLFDKNNKRISEQRFSSKEIKFIFADPEKLNGKVQNYVCEIKLASHIN
ncbi:hypothetical protein HYG89_05295 [Acinetobacter sp. SwsAc5]|uniref:surface-adhesin E family protein n=1 Tax=Acinetobacter sp. SwsAc5 TaxID=2749438 RepID=UPI0015BDD57A|nr:surface-adhesin E family protein [Acinetobacter sp. SwsAc5]NWK51983.1 hypothetical protein [Acinetobacter sp. SwsAc5]